MIPGATYNYTGRKVDLFVLGAIPTTSTQPMSMTIGTRGTVAAGVEKAAQKWLVALCTIVGTNKADPEFGCSFLAQLLQRQLNSDGEVSAVFASAVDEIARYDAQARAVDTPDDEIITSAELKSQVRTKSTLSLTIQLTTQAGATRAVVMPISLVTH